MSESDDVMRRVFGALMRGYGYDPSWREGAPPATVDAVNPLRRFFQSRERGRGIWKWDHYFDVYHRHLSRFRDRPVHVLEIGVHAGGSLEMWRDYFGSQAMIYGIDVLPTCKRLESERIRIFTGDQSDRIFLKHWCAQVPNLDIVIDDGSHAPEHQAITLEELLPHLRPGGVYICEDILGVFNPFATFTGGLMQKLNETSAAVEDPRAREVTVAAAPFQRMVQSVHTYPFITVVERTNGVVNEFKATKRGDEWPNGA